MSCESEARYSDPVSGWSGEECRRRFRELIEGGINVNYSLNFKTGRYEYVSKSIKNIIGYSAEEIMGLTLDETLNQIHLDDIAMIQRQTQEAAAYARSNEGHCEKFSEYRRRRKDGTWCWVRDCWRLYLDDAGEIDRITGSAFDISAQKNAEQQAQRASAFLQQAVNSLEDPFFIKDANHRWVMLNDIGFQMIGGTKEQVLGKTDYNYFPKEQADVFWERDAHVLETGITDVNEEEITWHGQTHYISTKKSLYIDPNTGEKFITGTIRDITSRREMENELRKKEILFTEALNASQQILYRLNFETGKYDYLSESVREISGYDPEMIRSRGVEAAKEFVHPEDWPEINEKMDQARQNRKGNIGVVRLEYRYRIRSGQYRWFSDWGTLFYDDEGNLLRGVGAVLDITERKELEQSLLAMHEQLETQVQVRTQQLAESEQKYRMLAEHITDIIALFNLDHTVYYVSPSWEKLTGWTQAETVGQPPETFTFPEEHDEIAAEFGKLDKVETIYGLKYRLRKKDGSAFRAETTARLIRDDHGEPWKYLVATRDVSERHKIENFILLQRDLSVKLNAAETTEHAFEMILDTIMQIERLDISGIYTVNEENQTLELSAWRNLSPAFVKEFGTVPLDDALAMETRRGKTVYGVAGRDFPVSESVSAGGYKAYCMAPIFHGGLYLGTVNVASKTQTAIERHEINAIEAIGSQVGSVIQRTRIAAALRQSEETARVLLNAIEDIVILVEADGTVVTVNTAAEQSLGYMAEQLIGNNIADFMHDPDVTENRMQMLSRAVEQQSHIYFEDQRDGREFEIDIYPIFDAHGQLDRLAIYGRDVTQQRKARQQLQEYQNRIRRVEQLASIGTLSATLAHELNQPLTVIQLYLQQSLRHLNNKPVQLKTALDKLSYCLIETGRADDIIKRFRDFAHKSEMDRPRVIDVTEIARRLVTALKDLTRNKNIKLRLDAPKKPLTYEASPSDFEQILFVLIQNSIQAGEGQKGAAIDITLKVCRGGLLVEVSDNCGGVDPAVYPRIFEPFFTTKPPEMGTGLGLSIVERIAQKYGAKIETLNLSGQGMTFGIYFP